MNKWKTIIATTIALAIIAGCSYMFLQALDQAAGAAVKITERQRILTKF